MLAAGTSNCPDTGRDPGEVAVDDHRLTGDTEGHRDRGVQQQQQHDVEDGGALRRQRQAGRQRHDGHADDERDQVGRLHVAPQPHQCEHDRDDAADRDCQTQCVVRNPEGGDLRGVLGGEQPRVGPQVDDEVRDGRAHRGRPGRPGQDRREGPRDTELGRVLPPHGPRHAEPDQPAEQQRLDVDRTGERQLERVAVEDAHQDHDSGREQAQHLHDGQRTGDPVADPFDGGPRRWGVTGYGIDVDRVGDGAIADLDRPRGNHDGFGDDRLLR